MNESNPDKKIQRKSGVPEEKSKTVQKPLKNSAQV